ncbi:MAG: zinc-ribbon domain-containing protein [Bacilli bacterium]|nr:zinc-ribbon domain-containing protein [Bacilli bacterium]
MSYHNNGIMVEHVKELLDLWDFEKNSQIGLDPKVLPVNSSKTAFWKCDDGHYWQEKIKVVYGRKYKCLYCKGSLVWPGKNDLQTLFPEIAAEWDYDKNATVPEKVSPRDTNIYWWKCKKGHPSFARSVIHRVNRHDTCPYCSGRKVLTGFNDLQTLFPEISKEWDYEKNNGVLPSEVYAHTWKSYYWVCPKGHHYRKKVYLRTHSIQSIDCPKCIKAHSTSFPEQALYYYAKQFYPDAINRYRGLTKSGLELDIYIPSWHIGIEYDGKPYHSSKEAKIREQQKYNICKRKSIRLIRVKEDDQASGIFDDTADEVFYVKKRLNDADMNNFLISFFVDLTKWSHNHFAFYVDPHSKRKIPYYFLGVDINIKRDRPKILEYLIDEERSFGTLYPELAKNWDNDRNGSLTPFKFTPGSNYPAFFKCERCGESWSATISAVTKWKRTLCKKCSMGDNGLTWTKRAIKENGSLGEKFKEAVEQWDKDANGNLTPFEIPINYKNEVFWLCPKCGYKWSQSPNSRVRKNSFAGCPHCTGRVAMPGVDDLQTLYPEIAAEWDYEKNGDITPSQIRPYNNKKRFWICSKHGVSFEAYPGNRIKGCGCYLCKSDKLKENKGFKVEQYTKGLEYIKTFSSLNEAGRVLNISPEAIRQAILKGTLSAGYYWKYEGTDFKDLKPDKKHCVVAINVKSGERFEYESAREAERQTGVGHSKIMNCCYKKEKYKTAGGFYWHFKDDKDIVNVQLSSFDEK